MDSLMNSTKCLIVIKPKYYYQSLPKSRREEGTLSTLNFVEAMLPTQPNQRHPRKLKITITYE